MTVNVKWYGNQFLAELNGKVEGKITVVARQVEALTKAKINELDLIDTGFMINSVYSVTAKNGSSTAGNTWDEGIYPNREGQSVERRKAPEMKPNKGEAIVHVAAEYFMDWELRYSILYGALQEAAAQL